MWQFHTVILCPFTSVVYKNKLEKSTQKCKSNFETRDGYTIAYGKEKISPSLAGALSSIVMLSALVPEDRPFIFVTENEILRHFTR